MAKRKKPRRKDLLKEPDEFLVTTGRFLRLLRQYGKWVIAGGIVVVVVGLTLWGWKLYQDRRGAQAMELYLQANPLYERALEQPDSPEGRDFLQKAVDRYQEVIHRYEGTRAAWLSRLYRARANHILGRYQEAVHDYRKALESRHVTTEIRPVILQGLGASLMASGELAAAAEVFKEIQGLGIRGFDHLARWNLARCLERQGKVEEALKIYSELKEGSSGSFQQMLAETKVRRLEQGRP